MSARLINIFRAQCDAGHCLPGRGARDWGIESACLEVAGVCNVVRIFLASDCNCFTSQLILGVVSDRTNDARRAPRPGYSG